jgi:outer membrane immunogenic protein
MKKFLFAVTAVSALIAGPAMAADLPVRAPAAYSPPPIITYYSWTGCYVGGNVGAGWAGGSITGPAGGVASGSSSAAFMGGGQFGCDYQTGALVIGIRNLIDWADFSRSQTLAAGGTVTAKNNWVDLLTARVGYAVQPAWLLYFQGGGAWTNGRVTQFNGAGTQIGEASRTLTGWTVGGGSEYKFAPNWSIFAEYNYSDFGKKTVVLTGVGTNLNVNSNAQSVLFGVNYRF